MESGLDQNMFSAGHSKQKQSGSRLSPNPYFSISPIPFLVPKMRYMSRILLEIEKKYRILLKFWRKLEKKTSENWPKHLHLKAEVARKKSKWTLALLSHSKPKQGKSKGVYTKKPNVIHKLINFRNSSDLLDLIELFFQLSK